MKKLQIKFNNIGTITLGVPTFDKKLSKAEKFVKVLTYLQQYLILSFIIFLPLSGYIYPNSTFENSVFYYSLYFAIANLMVFLSLLLLTGKRKLTDPVGFMIVLTFALMTTTSAIFVSNPTVSNTFGDDNFRL